MSNKTLGDYLKEVRLTKNISTSEIVHNLTITEDEYIQCERGKTSFYVDDIQSIAKTLGIDLNHLLNLFK